MARGISCDKLVKYSWLGIMLMKDFMSEALCGRV